MGKWMMILGMAVGAVGIFFGFYYLGQGDAEVAIGIVSLLSVGVVGVLAFVRHVVFHTSDAKRLGWETDRPDWMFEVGFANLAFGAMGFVAECLQWGIHAQALVVLGYALYLLQAAILHLYRYLTDEPRSAARLWRSVVATTAFAVMMAFIAVQALLA